VLNGREQKSFLSKLNIYLPWIFYNTGYYDL
jgi:hypothetical protein